MDDEFNETRVGGTQGIMKIQKRRRERFTEYYLLAKDGDSILYNDWYPIDSLHGESLVALPECDVTAWTIRNRIINAEKFGFKTLWEVVSKPSLRKLSGERKVKGRKHRPPVLSPDERQYIDNMKLIRPGSLAHTVR